MTITRAIARFTSRRLGASDHSLVRLVALYYVLLLLMGCSMESTRRFLSAGPKETHAAFMPYVIQFERDCGVFVRWKVGFEELEQGTGAVCVIRGVDRYVLVDTTEWQYLGDLGREQLIYHELGHCALGLFEHDEEYIQTAGKQMPRSIMFPIVFGDSSVYAEFRGYYINELCSKRYR